MVFEVDELTWAVGLGIIEVSSSNEMVAFQTPPIWEQETTPNQTEADQDQSR